MQLEIVTDVDSLQKNYEEIWVLVDRRNLETVRRCYFPNRAMVERCIKTMLKNNPECSTCPDDFYFEMLGSLVYCDGVFSFAEPNPDLSDVMEFKSYAS